MLHRLDPSARRKSDSMSILVLLALAVQSSIAQSPETAPDGVPINPVHLDEAGFGILRYSDPQGREIPLSAATANFSDSTSRPFEAWSTLGTWTRPDLSLCMQYMTAERLALTNAVQVYSPMDQRAVARFRFVIDPEQAEEIASSDGGTAEGECHSDFLR